MKKNRTFANSFAFQDAQATVKRILKEAKSNFWQTCVSSLNSDSKLGSVWKAIKALSGRYSQNSFPIKINNNGILSNLDKANIFANEFSYVSSDSNLPPNYMDTRKSTAAKFLKSLVDTSLPIPEMSASSLNLPFDMQELEFALDNNNNNNNNGFRVHFGVRRRHRGPNSSCNLIALRDANPKRTGFSALP